MTPTVFGKYNKIILLYSFKKKHEQKFEKTKKTLEDDKDLLAQENDKEMKDLLTAEIDELEKSEFESVKYVDYNESFLPFALAALVLIGCEIILNCTVFRKIP